MKAWPVLGISIVQGILCLAHWFIYLTWMHFGWPLSPGALHGLRVALAVLSFSFAFSALLSFRLVHPLVRLIYRIAVLWLGFAHFIFMACVTAWLVDPFLLFVAGPQRSAARHGLADLATGGCPAHQPRAVHDGSTDRSGGRRDRRGHPQRPRLQ